MIRCAAVTIAVCAMYAVLCFIAIATVANWLRSSKFVSELYVINALRNCHFSGHLGFPLENCIALQFMNIKQLSE